MKNKRFKPKFDKLFCIPVVIACILLVAGTVLAVLAPPALFVMIPCDLMLLYFMLSSFFGYAELRENTVFIKFGFFLKKEIPYNKIRRLEKGYGWYSESMTALKNSMEHVNIWYNTYDVTTVSVVDNDEFIQELCARSAVR